MTPRRYWPGAVLFMLVWTINITAQNVIEQENLEPGTRAWQIPSTKQALARQIEGYASATSVNIGETIRFYVNVKDGSPTFKIEIFRMGWYGGTGGRLIYTQANLPSIAQPQPEANHTTGVIECQWTMPESVEYKWDVPNGGRWGGVYLAKLIASTGKQSYIPFVVRDDARVSDYLFQTSVTTWEAYNVWPHNLDIPATPTTPIQHDWHSGKSLYAGPPDNPASFGFEIPEDHENGAQARVVSFNRPYLPDNLNSYSTAGHFFFTGEYNMVRWMEKEGYDVSYTTDVDTDAATDMANGPLSPGRHKVFLSVGHDEYWSWQMRDNIQKARDRSSQPLNIGWFGGNNVHWQIRFANSSSGSSPANAPRRSIIAYKDLARSNDPVLRDPQYVPLESGGSPTNYLTTNYWRENDVAHLGSQCPASIPNCLKGPEDEIVGVMSDLTNPEGSGDFEFTGSCPAWVKAGVASPETPFTALVGYEADRFFTAYPSRTTTIVADSDFVGKSTTTPSHAVYYKMNTGGRVFAAGTIRWGLGLDGFGGNVLEGPVFHPDYHDPRVEVTTRNILACLRDGGAACGE